MKTRIKITEYMDGKKTYTVQKFSIDRVFDSALILALISGPLLIFAKAYFTVLFFSIFFAVIFLMNKNLFWDSQFSSDNIDECENWIKDYNEKIKSETVKKIEFK